jgi:glycine/D-amino acid oxidase-like deaminating enzyme
VGRGSPLTRYDDAVIGLGIVGACAAYAVTRRGARVIALDAGVGGRGTSGTSFAWLNSVKKEPEAYHRLNVEGMAAHRELARELGPGGGHHEGGSLEWSGGGESEHELRARVEQLRSWSYAADWITREQAVKLEPGLAIPREARNVVFFADDAWLDAPRLIRTLIDAAAASGAEIHERTPVHSFRIHDGIIDALVVDHGEIAADSVLVCVGPATKTFVEALGVSMPVNRVPGLLAVTSRPNEALERVVHAPGIHLRPDASGGLLLGSEDVDGPAANTTSATEHRKLAELLLQRAGAVFPAARDTKIVEYRIGVRPMPGDRHTIAGRLPELANGWMIATHSGVTLGPLLGRLMADEIVRGIASPMLAPFRPDRFRVAATAAR